MKKTITLALVLVLLCSCLAGCDTSAEYDLTGRWESVFYYDAESVLAELESLDFYDEEIALVDPSTMGICEVLELNEDLTYTMTVDAVRSHDLVVEFYDNAFTVFFENREQLQDLYEEDFVSMSEDEFKRFYATMYGSSSYENLLYRMAGTADDYRYLEENVESGTYRVTLNRIFFTPEATSTEEYVTFKIPGEGQLSLEYEDSTVDYTKVE